MALATDLMGVGLPAEQATLIGQSDLTTYAATGTTQGTAKALSTSNNKVTTSSSNTGVILPSTASLTRLFFIQSDSANTNTLIVYPPTGGNFSGLAANTGISIPAGGFIVLDRQSSTYWGVVGTSFGSASGTSPASGQSVSPRTVAIGGLVPAVSTDFTDSTPAATSFYYGECFIPSNMTVTGVGVFQGSVSSGNMKVGLFDSTGAVVATSASTACSGTDAYQKIAFTAPYSAVGPATYYIGTMYDNATARYNAPPLGVFAAAEVTGQVYATGFTAITPATTFTANKCAIASLY